MKKKKTIQAIKMEFYKTRIFEERPNEINPEMKMSIIQMIAQRRLDQVEERLSGRDKVEKWNHPIKHMLSLKTNKQNQQPRNGT